MWVKLVVTLSLLLSPCCAQDRLVSMSGGLIKVSAANHLSVALEQHPLDTTIRFGSTAPLVSPDQRWIALIRDNNLWVGKTPSTVKRATTVGTEATKQYFSVDVYTVGFTSDSKYLLYAVAPGQRFCDNCKETGTIRKAAYGYYLFNLETGKSEPVFVPESTRVHAIVSPRQLYITQVGAYGDSMGFFNPATRKFSAFGNSCEKAFSCDLSLSGDRTACIHIVQGKTGIVDCNLREKSEKKLSDQNSCLSQFLIPRISPDGTHTAYMQRLGDCRSYEMQLMVDGTAGPRCTVKDPELTWVDNDRLLMRCDEGVVLSDRSGRRLGDLHVPPAEQRERD